MRGLFNGSRRTGSIALLSIVVGCALAATLQVQNWMSPNSRSGKTHHTVDHAFAQATRVLAAQDYAQADRLWRRVLAISPLLPEAWTNLGFASIGLGRADKAIEQFNRALTIRPGQVNAYYGLALAADLNGDRAVALGAMRTFVHLAEPDDPFVRRARSALWEWQS